MNAIDKALSEIEFEIPPQILQYAFIGIHTGRANRVVSVRHCIRDAVFKTRLITDCSITAGTHASIDLSNIPYEQLDKTHRIYRIPNELLGGREIMSTLSVGNTAYMRDRGHEQSINATSGTLLGAAQRVRRSHEISIPHAFTTDVTPIGSNVIMVGGDLSGRARDINLECILSSDENMSELVPRMYGIFSELAVLAVKAYIYTNCRIPLASAIMHSGAQLSEFREEIERYSDANTLYKEMLKSSWSRASLLGDTARRHRHLARVVRSR